MSRTSVSSPRSLFASLVLMVGWIFLLQACGGGGGGAPSGPVQKAFGTATLIETNTGAAFDPQIAIDANGNALAVWNQFDGTRYNIWSNRYTAATGLWGTAALIETENTGDAASPQIAIDANGNALAVWFQDGDTTVGVRYDIWSNRYTAATGLWGTATLIETDNTGSAGNPQIAIDANGNALAVWYQFDGTRNNIWSNRFIAGTGVGTGWGVPVLIETDNTGDASFPQIAIDANGNALAVWNQSDGMRRNVLSNRYTVGTGWGTPVLIETDNTGDAFSPQIAIDANGNALAVWPQDGDATAGVRVDIWSNRYTAATGLWGTAALLETDNADGANRPQIAIDANGNALAVWEQSDGTRNNIWSNRFIAGTGVGTGWGAPVLIETDDTGDAFAPQIAIDANGNALAVWYQNDGTRNNIWSNRYTATTGWGTGVLIETDNVDDAGSPQIAIDINGNALAVWHQHDGTNFSIWANRYQ